MPLTVFAFGVLEKLKSLWVMKAHLFSHYSGKFVITSALDGPYFFKNSSIPFYLHYFLTFFLPAFCFVLL